MHPGRHRPRIGASVPLGRYSTPSLPHREEAHSPPIGLRVFATARKTSTITDLAELGVETLPLELSDPSSIASLKASVLELTGGSLDMLVNNAGRTYIIPALDVDFDQVQQTFEINVFSVMRMCQAFSPLLIEAKGSIVQIGSLAAVIPNVFGSIYNASKAALLAYSNTLRVELAPFGVKVITVVTGAVESNIFRGEHQLPHDSLYLPVIEESQARLLSIQADAMSSDAYAKSVVSQVLRKSPRKLIWEGNKSWVVWFVSSFLPQGSMVRSFLSVNVSESH